MFTGSVSWKDLQMTIQSTPSSKITFSKYYFLLKGHRFLKEMSDATSRAGSGKSCHTRKKTKFQTLLCHLKRTQEPARIDRHWAEMGVFEHQQRSRYYQYLNFTERIITAKDRSSQPTYLHLWVHHDTSIGHGRNCLIILKLIDKKKNQAFIQLFMYSLYVRAI